MTPRQWALEKRPCGLSLVGELANGEPTEVYVDFVGGRTGWRLRHGGGKQSGLAKAIGLRRAKSPLRVLDLTAGLGRDAFWMASWGCNVLALERHPDICALLQDGLARALQDPETAAMLGVLQLQDTPRLLVEQGDGNDWLTQNPQVPFDVLYLDPMHPERKNTALVKKEMRAFRAVVGADLDSSELLQLARAHPCGRVVVKRPISSAPLAEGVSFAQKGRSTRYDVYLREQGAR